MRNYNKYTIKKRAVVCSEQNWIQAARISLQFIDMSCVGTSIKMGRTHYDGDTQHVNDFTVSEKQKAEEMCTNLLSLRKCTPNWQNK